METKSQKWFRNNKQKQREYVDQRRKVLKEWYDNYKSNLNCQNCSENHPACIEFHHLDPNEKEIEIAQCWNKGWSIERTLTEIAKCQVLCSNCHRKLHWNLRKEFSEKQV